MASSLHLSTEDNKAMVFYDFGDFSPYAGASGNTPYKIIFTDVNSLLAKAWCGEVGSGLSYGDEKFSDPSFNDSNKWTISNDSITISGGNCSFTAAPLGAEATEVLDLTFGGLYFCSITADTIADGKYSLVFCNSSAIFDNIADTGLLTGYATGLAETKLCGIRARDSLITTLTASNISIKKVIDIPNTGLNLYSEQDGTVLGMESIETGFDSNNVAAISIYFYPTFTLAEERKVTVKAVNNVLYINAVNRLIPVREKNRLITVNSDTRTVII